MSETTKQTLTNAYLQLLDEGGSKTITVTDVVERAGVSRMTFYYHFTDIYDLVDWIYRNHFEKVAAQITDASDAWNTMASSIIQMIDDNELGILDNYQHLDRNILDKNLGHLLRDVVEGCFDNDPKCVKFSGSDREFLIQLMTYCLTGMVSSWVDHDFNSDPQDYIQRFDRLIRQQIM